MGREETMARKRARWGEGGYAKNDGTIRQNGRPTNRGWYDKLVELHAKKEAK